MRSLCAHSERTRRRAAGAAAFGLLLLAPIAPAPAAETARSVLVGGMRLDETPERVVAWLKANYPQCALQRSLYHALPGETAGPLAIVAVNEGTMNLCSGTPEGSDSTDVVFVRFAHPSIAADRGVYELLVDRSYPDPLLTPQKRIRYTLDSVLADLRREFGRPIDEERTSRADESAASPGAARSARRDDRTVRLLWGTRGKLADARNVGMGHGHAHYECSECGDRFVIADIDVTRSRGTRPPDRSYVTRVSVFAQNVDVRRRQEAWNSQWLRSAPRVTPVQSPRAQPDTSSPAAPPPAGRSRVAE